MSNSKDKYTYGWYSASAGNNDMKEIAPTLDSQVIGTYLLN
jgi:hypothetical protein